MTTKSDGVAKILQHKISKFLGKRFTLKEYRNSENRPNAYEVFGDIRRYNESVEIQATVEKDTYAPIYWNITDSYIIMPTRKIGSIHLGQNVIVSDPCYDRDVWCMTALNNVKPGLWGVYAAIDSLDSWGKRCYILELHHTGHVIDDSSDWKECFVLCVDSGSMSVFDDRVYPQKTDTAENTASDKTEKECFREKCYRLTDNFAGIYLSEGKGVGVVCSSGTGDGSYPLYVAEKDGEIIAMKISFM